MRFSSVKWKTCICAGIVVGAAMLVSTQQTRATTATATATATVQPPGGVGTPPETPATDTTPATTTTTTTTTTTSTRIPTLPSATTSNVGFGDVAPVVQPQSAAEIEAASAASGNSSAPQTRGQAPRFARSGATPITLGRGGSSVSVNGSPNQAFTVSLPTGAVYASGADVVSLSDFQTTLGQTPTLNGAGSGVFDIGATVQTTNAAEISADGGPTVFSALEGQQPIFPILLFFY